MAEAIVDVPNPDDGGGPYEAAVKALLLVLVVAWLTGEVADRDGEVVDIGRLIVYVDKESGPVELFAVREGEAIWDADGDPEKPEEIPVDNIFVFLLVPFLLAASFNVEVGLELPVSVENPRNLMAWQ